MESAELAKYLDHTLLRADATPRDIEQLIEEGLNWGVMAVCINSGYVRLARNLVGHHTLHVASTIGFPLGQMSLPGTLAEVSTAIEEGADELDVMWNLGQFLAGNFSAVAAEISAISRICRETKTLLKVILESAILTPEQIKTGTKLVVDAGADMVKTSTGFGTGGATEVAIRTMRNAAPPEIGVKASGGVRTKEDAERFIQLGATRIGTSSTQTILGMTG